MVCSNKPINGKELQKESWQSDQLIVVMKRGNACGAKGLARGLWKSEHFFRTQRRVKEVNKTTSVTHSSESEEVFLGSRIRENRMYGSVRGVGE